MKKTLLSIAMVLAVIASACSGSKSEDSMEKPAIRVPSDSGITCNIRYFDFDSVMHSYVLYQELSSEFEKEFTAYQNTYTQKQNYINSLMQNYQKNMQTGVYMTEVSRTTDETNIQNNLDAAGRWDAAQQQKLKAMELANLKRLDDSLQNFLTDFNAVCNYDAIFNKTVGFFDPKLDVTDIIIEGLNQRYKPATATTPSK